MALLQIAEPGQATVAHEHRLAVGIDLGTTNSLVATVRSGIAETLPDAEGRHLLPSIVRYLGNDVAPEVGYIAQQALLDDPLNTIVSVKRLMGRGVDDVLQDNGHFQYRFSDTQSVVPKIETVAGAVTPIEVSSVILAELKQRAEKTLGDELQGAVITVPAYFDDAQRQATKDAARLAGLNVLRLLNEPTAAAIAYGLDCSTEGVVAVYDLGGGTFDISILRLNKGVFEVLATGGDTALGGDDMDLAIARWMLAQAGIEGAIEHHLMRRVLHDACVAKEQLTEQEQVIVSIEAGDVSWQTTLDRAQLNELIDALLRKTLKTCRQALRDAGMRAKQVDDVVLVGGSTRVLKVRELVADFFSMQPKADIDPDKVVAIGAGVQADILIGNKPDDDMLLLDVIPLSLGIETMGGLVEKIIARNTTIPVARAQEFTTFKDGQTALAIHVLQGERDLVSDCRSLARFELRDIPPMTAGAARIKVTLQVDADGLLNVSAFEATSGVQSHVEVKPSYGLSDGEIESMLRDSMDSAKDDMEARRLREQQVDADRVLEAISSALQQDGDRYLSPDERAKIDQAVIVLRAIRDEGDTSEIKSAISWVEKSSIEYVERRMNASIQQAMSGHTLDEF